MQVMNKYSPYGQRFLFDTVVREIYKKYFIVVY